VYQEFHKVPIFAGLNEETLEALSNRAHQTVVPAGALVVKEGDMGNRFYLIGSGSVRVVKHAGEPTEVVLAILRKGEFFGEMCILETLPRVATVEALEETKLFSLSSLAFYYLYESAPKEYCILALNIARDLSRRIRHLDEQFAARH
jgi:CRP/FNR family cyclic AMP-dependent transcriptional regulator